MTSIFNRSRLAATICAPALAGLLLLTGCSHPTAHAAPQTTPTTASAIAPAADTATSTGGLSSPAGSAVKANFCRDINTVVNVLQSPGTNLDANQSNTVINALANAAQAAPVDTPPATADVINALLADMQAPTTTLPPSFATNATKLAQYAANYCG
jgi:hypothetical protein